MIPDQRDAGEAICQIRSGTSLFEKFGRRSLGRVSEGRKQHARRSPWYLAPKVARSLCTRDRDQVSLIKMVAEEVPPNEQSQSSPSISWSELAEKA